MLLSSPVTRQVLSYLLFFIHVILSLYTTSSKLLFNLQGPTPRLLSLYSPPWQYEFLPPPVPSHTFSNPSPFQHVSEYGHFLVCLLSQPTSSSTGEGHNLFCFPHAWHLAGAESMTVQTLNVISDKCVERGTISRKKYK